MQNFRIQGSTTNVAEVNVDAGLQIKPSTVNASNTPTSATGGLRFYTQNDYGLWTGDYLLNQPETSGNHRFRCGLDTLLFYDNFNMTAQNTGIWKTVFTTMTLTVTGGFLLFNTGLTGAVTTGVGYSTWRYFSQYPSTSLLVEGTFEFTSVPQANQLFEFGLFLPPAGATTGPVDGVYFRLTSNGLCGVVNYNGTERSTGDIIKYDHLGNLIERNHTLYMEIDNRQVQFWMDDKLLGVISIPPLGYGAAYMTPALPLTMQQRNIAVVMGTPLLQVKCTNVAVYLGDFHTSKPWPHQMSGLGLHSSQLGNGTSTPTITTCMTALYTNSLAAGTGVAMTNTTAALGVGLGGQFGALPTLAVPNDGVLSSYAVPAGTVNTAPRTLYVTGVRVQGAVTTTLTGGPVIYAYALCYGHTTVSLAQVETGSFATATTKAPRRIPLGFETYASGAIAGVVGGPGIAIDFQVPIVVNPGEFIAVSAKNLGVVTTLGVINALVTINGYFE